MKVYWTRLTPLAGLIFAGLFVGALAGTSSSPSSGASAGKVVSFYVAHRHDQFSEAFLVGYGVVFALVYAAALRAYLHADRGSYLLATLGFAGMIVFSVLAAGQAAATFAAADVARSIQPAAEQALNVLSNDLWDPIFIGIAVFLIANGLAIARSRSLPTWLGWAAVVIGVVAMLPAPTWALVPYGFAAWVAAASVVLFVRGGKAEVVAASAAAPG